MDSTWARVLDFLLDVVPQMRQRQLPSDCLTICSSMASSKAGRVEQIIALFHILNGTIVNREVAVCAVSFYAFSWLFLFSSQFHRYHKRCQQSRHALPRCGSQHLPYLHFHNGSPHNTMHLLMDPDPSYLRSSCPKLKKGRIFLLSFHWVISVYSHEVHIQGGFGRLNSATDVTRIRAIRVFGFNVVDQATLIGCLEVAICTAEGIWTVANHLALKIQPSLHFFPNCNT